VSLTRKFQRQQPEERALRKRIVRRLRTIQRAKVMRDGLFAESARRRKRAKKDAARDARTRGRLAAVREPTNDDA
jgi:hypothetical protein